MRPSAPCLNAIFSLLQFYELAAQGVAGAGFRFAIFERIIGAHLFIWQLKLNGQVHLQILRELDPAIVAATRDKRCRLRHAVVVPFEKL